MAFRANREKRNPEITYQNKVEQITKWYNSLLKNRETEVKINPNNKLPCKRKNLKPLDWYLEKIKKEI
jgi:hypothetical protein